MRCPICDSELYELRNQPVECHTCGVFSQTPTEDLLLRRYGFVTGAVVEKRVRLALPEFQKVYAHSEWERWQELVRYPERYTTTTLGAFADWCADNGFPLQEQAVRALLSRE